MYRIRLSDGTEFPARFCSARGGLLTMGILSNGDLLSVAQAFTGNSAAITFLYDESQDVFNGYTDLIMINGSTVGEYQLTLRKGSNNDTVS